MNIFEMDRSLESADSGSYGCCSSVILRTDWMNNDTYRPSDSLSATHRRRATSPMWSPSRQHFIHGLLYSSKMVTPAIAGVTILALLAGSHNTTDARNQLSIRSGRDCVRERL